MLMFLTYLEIPIIVTAAVAITDDLGGLERVGWIVASYLLGYIGWRSISPPRTACR